MRSTSSAPPSRAARSPVPRRCARWRSSPSSSHHAAVCTAAPSAISASPAPWIRASSFAPIRRSGGRYTFPQAVALSPTPTPSRNTARPLTRLARSFELWRVDRLAISISPADAHRLILLLDNYDSFVYNLSRYVRELGEDPVVVRNDAISVNEIRELAPSHIIVSPGPCTPSEAGISVDLVRELGRQTPILGVCLGHQAIGAAYGAEIVRARKPMHGKTSRIHHDGSELFAGVPTPNTTSRYHSLVIAPDSLPPELR